jgi:tetratricopeptide (TPR) repeat protein
VLRALQGLAENSGRTIVIAGPPMSGKTALLVEIKEQVKEDGARIVELRGSYRSRSIPYGALDGLRGPPLGIGETGENGAEDLPAVPLAPMGYLPDRLPRSRRSRAERPRSTFLGQPIRARSANEGNPDAYWREILPEFGGDAPHPVAIIIEDGALFDSESREFVVALSNRARLRPLLIVIDLDTSVPGFVAWEEAFLGRPDVDWVRRHESQPDPREAHRLKALFDDIPAVTQRVVGYIGLLGGSVGEVVLSRVTRLNFSQLAEALLPATGVGLVKVQDGKVAIPHLAWIQIVGDLLPETQRREMHLDIANALAALSPEPSLLRRIEVANHFLAWYPGPMALRHLLEAAELSLHLLSYDTAEGLFAQAIACLGALPPAERTQLEPELRLLHARALFPAGRLTEAESELRDGVNAGLSANIPAATLTEWVEPLILDMRVVGPRPSLATALLELVERCHDARVIELEVLLEALIAEFHYERNWAERARQESHRAALLARKLPEGHLQAIALLAVGLSRIEGSAEEQQLAARFLQAARLLLGRSRRWELDHMAEDLEARLAEVQGDGPRARMLRERGLGVLQRQKLLPIELYHQLGIAEILLDSGATKNVSANLSRARTIEETLHLLPPSPGLLRTWLLEGRHSAIGESLDSARDFWTAVADEPGTDGIPRLRAEALLRLALLERAAGRETESAEYVARLQEPDVQSALPRALVAGIDQIASWAPISEHGGARLPPVSPAGRREAPQRRERSGGQAVRDRQRADDH